MEIVAGFVKKSTNVKNVFKCKLLWLILSLSILFICLANTGACSTKTGDTVEQKPLNNLGQCPVPPPQESIIYMLTNFPKQLLSSAFEFLSFHDLINLSCYDLTNNNFFTKFQKRTYGSLITENVPHPEGTHSFPNSMKQIAEFPDPSQFVQVPAIMILYHDGRLELEGFDFTVKDYKPEVFQGVESLFFYKSHRYVGQEYLYPNRRHLYVSYFNKTVIEVRVWTTKTTFSISFNEELETQEFFSIFPSVLGVRHYLDQENEKYSVFVLTHSFDKTQTSSTRSCKYSTTGEHKFVVHFDESSQVIKSIEIDDTMLTFDQFLNFHNNKCSDWDAHIVEFK